MTRRDISLFGRAFTALSIVVRVAEELPAPTTVKHAEYRIGQQTEAIRDVLHRMDRIALENGVYYDEATRYFVNSLVQRTFALRKLFA